MIVIQLQNWPLPNYLRQAHHARWLYYLNLYCLLIFESPEVIDIQPMYLLYGADTLETKDGRHINWREQLSLKLINLQRPDGSWANDNGRWFEKDPVLVTAYSIIALEIIHTKL